MTAIVRLLGKFRRLIAVREVQGFLTFKHSFTLLSVVLEIRIALSFLGSARQHANTQTTVAPKGQNKCGRVSDHTKSNQLRTNTL